MSSRGWMFLVVHSLLAVTLGGSCIIAALALGFVSVPAIVISILIGFFAAVPAAWIIVKNLRG